MTCSIHLGSSFRLRLVGRKTFFRKTIFLYFQFYIVWLAKECKIIFPWGKITLPMMKNHFPFKMKGKLFSLSLLYTPPYFPFHFPFISSFFYIEPNNGKLIWNCVFHCKLFSMKIILHWKCFTPYQTEPYSKMKIVIPAFPVGICSVFEAFNHLVTERFTAWLNISIKIWQNPCKAFINYNDQFYTDLRLTNNSTKTKSSSTTLWSE